MRRLGSVQQKIPCVFVTEVRDEPSAKRQFQQYQVVATEDVNPKALESNIDRALATEKLDGTCCYVSTYKGEPHLWARLDRKPTKQADKRFKKFKLTRATCEDFTWNVEEDFRNVPDSWIPAHGVQHQNGQLVPDENGHIPGWVPVDKHNKQYCWHASVVNCETGKAVVLRPSSDSGHLLEIRAVPLSDLLEQTLELIGTNVNANPYGLGSKKQPIHVLVPHGGLPIRNAPPVNYQQLMRWFQDSEEGRVEGIVWHCGDGTLIKLHRHHVGLRWPEGEPYLNSRPVIIGLDWEECSLDPPSSGLFSMFSRLAGQSFDHIRDIPLAN